jgi:hypothetical protein
MSRFRIVDESKGGGIGVGTRMSEGFTSMDAIMIDTKRHLHGMLFLKVSDADPKTKGRFVVPLPVSLPNDGRTHVQK